MERTLVKSLHSKIEIGISDSKKDNLQGLEEEHGTEGEWYEQHYALSDLNGLLAEEIWTSGNWKQNYSND